MNPCHPITCMRIEELSMFSIRRSHPVARASVFILALALCAVARAKLPSADEIRTTVLALSADAATQRNILLEPRFSQALVSGVFAYAGNFCTDADAKCVATLNGGQRLRLAIESYIDDVRRWPGKPIQALGDRLADGRFPAAGIPTHETVAIEVVPLPLALRGASLSIHFAGDEVQLGKWRPTLLVGSGVVRLDADLRGKRSKWQIVATGRSPASVQRLEANTAGPFPINPLPSAYCTDVRPPEYRGPFAGFNVGRAKFGESAEVRAKNEAPLIRSYAVDIAIGADSALNCNADCQAALSMLFADAIVTWKSGCERCERDTLIALRTPSKHWLDWRVTNRLKLRSAGKAPSLDLSQHLENESGAGSSPFVDLESEPEVKTQLCNESAATARWIASAQELICQPSDGKNGQRILRARLTLLTGTTQCGPAAIACGLPDAGIEISFANYRLALPSLEGGRNIVVGPSSTRGVLNARPMILHEVGHWFGVPHAETGGDDRFLDIMAEAYGDGRPCVSPHSLRMTANAGDLRWPFRISSGGSLLGPRVAAPTEAASIPSGLTAASRRPFETPPE